MFILGCAVVILLLAFLQAVMLDLDLGDAFEPYGRVLESVMEGHIPFDAIGSNLVGAFAVAATLTMFTVWALIASFAALLVTDRVIRPLFAARFCLRRSAGGRQTDHPPG